MWDTHIRKVYDLNFRRHEDVYGPEEDTVILLQHLSQFDHRGLPPGPVAEACCGLGLAGVLMAMNWGRQVIVSDINPKALAAARENAAASGTSVQPVRTYGLKGIRDGTLSFVACNPPYLPGNGGEDWESAALDGGPRGVETALEVARDASGRLREGGRVMMLLSSLGDLENFEEEARGMGFSIERSGPHPVGDFERLYVYTMAL